MPSRCVFVLCSQCAVHLASAAAHSHTDALLLPRHAPLDTAPHLMCVWLQLLYLRLHMR